MVPEQVINAVHEQMRPLVVELARHCLPGEKVTLNFEVGSVEIKF